MRTPRIGRHGVPGILVMAACLIGGGCGPGEPPANRVPEVPEAAAGPDPDSAPEERAQNSRAVVAEALPYGEVDERLVYGYFAIPEDMIDPLPALIVVHDWWGLDGQMRSTAERLAGEGYIVLAVDLFGGETAAGLAAARDLEIALLENPELAMENLRQGYDFIADTAGAPRIAILGFGFGGTWSLNAATDFTGKLSAIVTYYGQVHDDTEKLANLSTPLLGLFAQNDRAVPAQTVDKFKAALESLEKDYQIHMYPNTRRGFADPRSDNYDAGLAADAWTRVLDFLEPRLTAGSE